MNHKHIKRIVLCTAALVALLILVAVGTGVGASANKGATAGTPCCERHAPTQAEFPMMQQIAGTPCCERHAPTQIVFQSARTSSVYATITAHSRGSTISSTTWVTPAFPGTPFGRGSRDKEPRSVSREGKSASTSRETNSFGNTFVWCSAIWES
jgi:hypothetical protein